MLPKVLVAAVGVVGVAVDDFVVVVTTTVVVTRIVVVDLVAVAADVAAVDVAAGPYYSSACRCRCRSVRCLATSESISFSLVPILERLVLSIDSFVEDLTTDCSQSTGSKNQQRSSFGCCCRCYPFAAAALGASFVAAA